MGKNVAGVVGGYLPQAMTEMFEPARDFAYIKLKNNAAGEKSGEHVRTVIAFSDALDKDTPHRVYVATSDGKFYTFKIDQENGGECVEVPKSRQE